MSRAGATMDEIKMTSGTMSNLLKDEFDPRYPWYDAFNLDVDDIMYLRDIVKRKPDLTKGSNLKISTIHGVKGGEADNVFLMLDVTRTVYENLQKLPDSELRCFYVGVTRAKNNLYIIRSNTRYGFDIGMEE